MIRLSDALEALRAARRDDEVVVTTMAPARDWMALSKPALHPLDLVLVPSAMGQATSMGLGLALAQPRRRIIVVNGDGSMLMNLGSLVSITAAAPENLVVVLCDNGVYEVTGSQPTPGSPTGRRDGESVDFVGLARACGFRSVFRFGDADAWRAHLRDAIDAPGPTFILLDIEVTRGIPGPRSPGPASERSLRFMEALKTEMGSDV
jgi:thiamine pyrophosphate-dependent acetolactate synthase large subunit-like protein